MTLADVPVRGRARITAVAGAPGLAQRLLEMGLVPGTEIEVVRVAPLGDPMELRLWGYLLSLRKGDARGIDVEPLS